MLCASVFIMEKITVFTPTYNRKGELRKLYESLLHQTVGDFIWMIVDDGSTDGTGEVVQEWIDESKVAILYYFQENSGKMIAHNRGVLSCTTDLFVCVDSDDYLVDNAIELILKHYEAICNDESLCGIVAYRSNSINSFPVGIEYSTLSDLYRKGFKGETTLIFKTSVLRCYLFEVFEGEKFIPESFIYNQIDDKYKYLVLRETLIMAEYKDDGYTQNAVAIAYNNPKGYALCYNEAIKRSQSLIEKLRNLVLYVSFSLLCKYPISKIVNASSCRYLCVFLFPLGIYKAHLIKREYLRIKNS